MRSQNVLLTTFNVHHPNHYTALALGYLKAYAMNDKTIKKNANIEIVDFCKECNSPEQVLFYLSGLRPDVIGFACYVWNAGIILDLARLVKQVLPDVKIVLGGPEVGPVAEDIARANPDIDVVVRGEGEATFSELLSAYINENSDLTGIKGIVYRKDGEIESTPDRPLIEDLDTIPSPYLTGAIHPKDQVAYLETYRGCPYRCAYCFEGKEYRKLRYFSPERTQKELELFMKTPGMMSFSFVDPVFNLNKAKVKELTGLVKSVNERGVTLHTIEIASELIDKETVQSFKKAKVVSVETGPQSANEDTLENVKRSFNRDKFAEGVRLCVEGKLKVLCDLMIGLPGDDFFKFIRSIDYVLSLKPGVIIFSTLNVLPGTYLYQNAQKFGIVFDKEPPHLVLSIDSFPYREIRTAETFSISLSREYQTALV